MRKTGKTLVLVAMAAANEATLSRIFAGQHTMIDLVAGQQLGHRVAGFVLRHLGPAPADAR